MKKQLVICTLCLALVGCGNQENSAEHTDASSASSSSTNNGSEYIDETLNGGSPAWLSPVAVEGWNLQPTQQNGVYLLEKDNGCMFVTSQNHFVTPPTGSDNEETQIQVEAWKHPFSEKELNPTFQDSRSEEVQSTNGPVEMARVNTDYTGEDGLAYRSSVWIRAFTKTTNPTFVSVAYSCKVADYSEEEQKTMLGNTQLANVTQLKMS